MFYRETLKDLWLISLLALITRNEALLGSVKQRFLCSYQFKAIKQCH